ncbi:hypothetical protein CBFG_02995 [Clostridiales bacterium 1_7_47FAA]|nr:hypothetical protein CBFG_02995 [Clostridiales bacterium 1_7_47FAA]
MCLVLCVRHIEFAAGRTRYGTETGTGMDPDTDTDTDPDPAPAPGMDGQGDRRGAYG